MVELAQQLSHASQGTVSASAQVSSAAQSLSQGATEQAASLEETSASMEEMASMTRQNAENSRSAAVVMGEVDGRVRESNAALEGMVASMLAIRESSEKVSKIIKTIDEIAFQTNILALNAAVEAARAGEAGMGFAVVADEVRNLAQRSAQAAKDTAGLIEESMSKAASGSRTVEHVASSISGITESVAKVKGLIDEVSVASQQQSQGIDQVAQAIAQMEKVTQTTAATAEESAAASEELTAQADTAMTVVMRLEELVGAAHANGRPGGVDAPASHAASRITAAPTRSVSKAA
jgi:methyl-accepting chemotaxis protein/methyl-accepting chemotaxis protein-1 (serine sensor receptor)